MDLRSGARLGPYEVVSAIGAGGMGEVYKAIDTRLGRAVAIKILPADFAHDANLKIRFEREAKTISALNHPHICTLFDVGENYLVMELCDGQTLARRLTRGPLPLDQVLQYGIEISDALDKAHRNGIIHRDLKPSNVMLTKSGVKLLDFGLAKQQGAVVEGSAASTTMMKALTDESKIVGTLQYMAPETLDHGRVDARSDIFALGLVLYEMATGKPAFSGSSKVSLIAAILEHEPTPLTELQPASPVALDRLIRSCLAKDPEARIGTAGDVAIALRWVRDSRQEAASIGRSHPQWLPWSVAAAGVAIAITAAIIVTRTYVAPRQPAAPLRLSFRQITDDAGQENMPALSPDGKYVAYVSARSGNEDIYLQRIGGSKAVNLTADSLANDSQPAFSRDGQWIAFRSEREGGGIYVMGATGESLKRVSDFGSHPNWSPDGKELVVSSAVFSDPRLRRAATGELWIIDVNSGRKRRITSLSVHGDAVQPSWSPHGDRIAFFGWSRGGASRSFGYCLVTVPAHGGKPLRVLQGADNAMNPVWSSDGRYLYFSSDHGGTMNLSRVPIDETSGKTTGDPIQLTTPARTAWPLSIAADGHTVAYCAREFRSQMQRITLAPDGTRADGPTSVFGRTTAMTAPAVSADGEWLTFTANGHVYVARTDGRDVRQLTDGIGIEMYPSWSPDATRIAFHSDRGGKSEAWSVGADGSGLTQITRHPEPVYYPQWSRDGSRISVRADRACKAGTCIVDMRESFPVTPRGDALPPYEAEPGWLVVIHDWSPDGKWLSGAIWRDEQHPTRMIIYSFETRSYMELPGANPLFEGVSRWMPDNRHLLFSDGRKIQMMDRITRTTREVADAGGKIDGFITVTKDGRYLYYVLNSEESDVWLATLDEGARKP